MVPPQQAPARELFLMVSISLWTIVGTPVIFDVPHPVIRRVKSGVLQHCGIPVGQFVFSPAI
jgi:hypothetical protein